MDELAEKISDYFNAEGHIWRLNNGKEIIPDQDDVSKALDAAAGMLYDDPIGSFAVIAGLLVVKTEAGYSTYVYTGEYT